MRQLLLELTTDQYLLVAVPSAVVVAVLGFLGYRVKKKQGRPKT